MSSSVGIVIPKNMGSHKIHVPNHQPVLILMGYNGIYRFAWESRQLRFRWGPKNGPILRPFLAEDDWDLHTVRITVGSLGNVEMLMVFYKVKQDKARNQIRFCVYPPEI